MVLEFLTSSWGKGSGTWLVLQAASVETGVNAAWAALLLCSNPDLKFSCMLAPGNITCNIAWTRWKAKTHNMNVVVFYSPWKSAAIKITTICVIPTIGVFPAVSLHQCLKWITLQIQLKCRHVSVVESTGFQCDRRTVTDSSPTADPLHTHICVCDFSGGSVSYSRSYLEIM